MMWRDAAVDDFAVPSRGYDSMLAYGFPSGERTPLATARLSIRARARKRVRKHRKIGRGAMTKTSMATARTGDIPRQNPCAQCGTPIAQPDWIEPGEGRISYLWNCRACGLSLRGGGDL